MALTGSGVVEMDKQFSPIVSIGLPVYNGAATIRQSIEALMAQTFAEFELIISDNASTDETSAICLEYARKDDRVRYVRQETNIGASRNFKFVLDNAVGEFFMWAGADDFHSSDFLDVNIRFLMANEDYVASASPDIFDYSESIKESACYVGITGSTVPERFNEFFSFCWRSHGIYYSLMRTVVVRDFSFRSYPYLGFDWALDLHLAFYGKVSRSDKGLLTLGSNGASMQSDIYSSSRYKLIEYVLPFYEVSKYALSHSTEFDLRDKFKLLASLAKLNIEANINRLRRSLSPSN